MFNKRLLPLTLLALAVACGDDDKPSKANNTTNNSTNNTSNNSSNNASNNASNNTTNNSTNNTTNNMTNLADMGDDMSGSDMGDDMTGSDMGDDMTQADMGSDMTLVTEPDPAAAAQITAVRSALTGTISGAAITYIKAGLGNDAQGFFVQASPTGPALFVESTESVVVGDIVSFDVTTAEVGSEGFPKATAIANLTVLGFGYDVTLLTQDVGATTDLVTALSDYELELVDTAFTVTSGFNGAGTDHSSATVETIGVTGTNDLRLRLPTTLADAYGFETGCTMNLNDTPLWRFAAQAQLSAYYDTELSNIVCPAPVLQNAVASSDTTVVLTFSRPVDDATVAATATQFTVDNGLTVTAAVVNGNQVTLTTSSQAPGTTYTITVADTVLDVLGAGVSATGNSETFLAYEVIATIRINEIAANEGGGCDAVEFRVVTGGTLRDFTFFERTSSVFTFPDVVVATNDLIVLHFDANDIGCGYISKVNETTAIDEFPALINIKNYDSAWDFFTTDSGITSTDNTLTVYDNVGTIQDGVLTGCGSSPNAAGASESAAATLVAAMQWQNIDGTVPAGGYVDIDYCDNAVLGLPDSDLSVTLQRTNDADINDKSEWTLLETTSTFGLLNVGQTAF